MEQDPDQPLTPLELGMEALQFMSDRAAATLGDPEATTMDHLAAVDEIAKKLDETKKQIGIMAVERGDMTRVDVGKTINRHPLTISRWLRASRAVETPDEP